MISATEIFSGGLARVYPPFGPFRLARPLDLEKDLLEEPLRDILGFRNIADMKRRAAVMQGHLEHGPTRILASRRKPHKRRPY
jgi:hypothetical protein